MLSNVKHAILDLAFPTSCADAQWRSSFAECEIVRDCARERAMSGCTARAYTRPDPTVRCVTAMTASRKRTSCGRLHPSKDDPAKPWLRLSLAVTVRATVAILGKKLSFLGRTGQPECQSLVVDVACAMAGEHDVIECREAGSVPLVLHVL